MDKIRCKNATNGKCPDEECPHFDKHEKRFDCHLDCNRFIEDDTSCEAVNPEPIEPKISPYALPSQACDEYFTPPEPQQTEGELVNACKGCSVEGIQPGCSEEDKNKCDRWDLAKAQLAHNKATMVTLPSEERAADIVEALDKKFPPLSDTRLAGLELLRLLKGEAKQ